VKKLAFTTSSAILKKITLGINLAVFILALFTSTAFSSVGSTINQRTRFYTQQLSADSLVLKFDNTLSTPVTFKLSFIVENLKNNMPLQLMAVVEAKETGKIIATFSKKDFSLPYKCSYNWVIVQGDTSKTPDANCSYSYPFSPSETYTISQGPGGSFSHASIFAYDFLMPVGTAVAAAREGIVALIKADGEPGGADKRFTEEANFISILHADGTVANYFHLQKNGVKVQEGQVVKRGEIIGFSGNSGFSSGPHLHFEVTRPSLSADKNKWVVFTWESSPALLKKQPQAFSLLKAGSSLKKRLFN